ncbi:MAG: AAA family ATPase, partial [Xanthobacteraceae bacterium]
MRLLTLELERYGPFTGRTLSFSADANLHVVFGQNEAGKSSALAAITDLFFGIERQTRFDFVHDARELRIGGTVVANDGRSLAFRRRKGNKDTLVGVRDEAIGEDSLAPFLGTMTRDVFCNAFGLDADALQHGAEDMLKSEGEIGASLFAAASGLRGLSELRRHLEDEATSIFAARASKDRKFYIALRRFEDARKAIRERELRAAYWKDLNEKIEKLSRRLEAIRELRGIKAAQRARLLRNKRIAPLIQLIDDDLKRLDGSGTLPELPVDFCEGLANALEAVRKGSEAKQRAQEDE